MSNYAYIAWIPLLPLASFLALGLFGGKVFKHTSGILACTALLIATVLSLYAGYEYFFAVGRTNGIYEQAIAMKFTWLEFSPGLSIDMSIVVDPISVMMLIVVSFISLMVHIFSLGYMKGDDRFPSYFAFLSLFTFSMLGLSLSGNILQIYIFWELVGVSSYLLIGYYFDRPAAVSASKKAFIVTRLADLAFLVGILILAYYGETLDFPTLIQRLTAPSPQLLSLTTASFLGISLLTWGLVCIFIGGAGKSAMFPLHIWLPDAMEGPTPVSALIHAATMVVAGVFLVARLFPVFAISGPEALHFVMYVGAFSSLLAAVIACVQTDIKRTLAYSTMSQIGYMMFALGVSGYGGEHGLGYTASMFHLFTHAFFKSLLFLCAGVIIHLTHSNDMNNMGGLRKHIPFTHACFLIACLAISGIPPFSGFFSKEEILLAAYHSNTVIYSVGLFISGLTAFYMFRLYFSIFWRKESTPHGHDAEKPATVRIPLLILAAGTILAGFAPFTSLVTTDGAALSGHFNIFFSIAPVTIASAGIFFAAYLYKKENDRPLKIAASLGGWYRAAQKKFYIDEVYLFITRKFLFSVVGKFAAWFDRNVVDGLMNLLAGATAKISELIKGVQSGKVQNYTLYFFGGVIGLAVIFIYLWR